MAVRRDLKAAICPYVRTMLSAPDAPGWNPGAEEMEVAELVAFVRAQPGSGSLDEVYIKGEKGYVILQSVGAEAVLTVLAREGAKMGLVFLDMRRAAEDLAKLV